MKLTANQEMVLNYCVEVQTLTGKAPRTQDVSEHMGWQGTNRANDVMMALAARGYARLIHPERSPRPGASRQWEMIEQRK